MATNLLYWDKMCAYLAEQYAGMLNNLIVIEGCFALDVEQYMDKNTQQYMTCMYLQYL